MNTPVKLLKPRKALNKAFLKVKPNRSDIEKFKVNLITLVSKRMTGWLMGCMG
jgi:adenine-specific DNA-methyltransferase